jgi:serine/threonine-protein kinase
MGHTDAAETLLDETAAIYAKVGVAPRTAAYNAYLDLRVHAMLADRRPDDARALIADYFVETAPPNAISLTDIEHRLLTAEIDLAAGDFANAAERARGVGAAIRRSAIADYLALRLARADFVEGSARLRAGDAAAARAPLTEARELRARLLLPTSPKLAEAEAVRAECLARLGETADALAELAAARATERAQPELAASYHESIALADAALSPSARAR